MAHYVASVNVFEYPGKTRVSLKVFRVYEYGARPSRPVWKDVVTLEMPPDLRPRDFLLRILQELHSTL